MPDRERDVFISYRWHDREQVDQLAQALQSAGLSVWLDRNEIENASSIQQRIDQGLAQARVLLAWYSAAYPHSRPCQWELTAALIAATAETGPVRRVLVVNPEPDVRHIQPIQLRDLQHFNCTADFPQLAERIREAIQPVTGTLGALRRLSKPRWHGLHGLGSNRFTGRETDLWAIHSALTGGNFAIVAGLPGPGASADLAQVRGSGGIGKSLLAEEYGLRFGAAWPGGVFWMNGYGTGEQEEAAYQLNARRKAAYSSQLGAFALQLGLDVRDQSDEQLRVAIGRTLTESTLWIVDDLPACTRQELEPWLAPSPLARTLITTRSRRMDSLGAPIDLGMLDPEAARSLLTLDHPPRPEEEEAVADILQMLDGYALALDVARAACRRLGYQVFCRRLQQPDADAFDLAAQLAPDLPNGHNSSIAATLLSAFHHLDESGLDVLRLAAHLAQAPIPQDLPAACLAKADGLDQATAEERAALGLQQVLDHSLAEEITATEAFTVHALVTRTAKRHDATADRRDTLRAAALAVVNQWMAAAVDIRQHTDLQPLLPHAQLLAADSHDQTSLSLVGWLGRFELEAGRYREAQIWYDRGYQGHVALLGEDHPDALTAMNNLAWTRSQQGDLQGAHTLHEKALEIRIRVLGEKHPDTLASMGNLATTLLYQGDLQGAQVLQQRGFEVCTRLFGEEHPHTLTFMNNLATTLRNQGDLQGAWALMEKELAISTSVFGEEHPNTLISMGNMASTLRAQGNLQGARELENKGLEVCNRIFGEEHPNTLTFTGNIASTFRDLGDLSRAQELQEKVLEVRTHVLGEEHYDTLTSMGDLALTLRDQGNLQDARALMEKDLEICTRLLGEEHPDTLASMSNLALTLQDQGDLQGARTLQKKVLGARARVLGEEHPNTLISMSNLAGSLQSQGDLQGARTLLEKIMEIRVRLLGKEHPDTLSSMNNLAGTIWNQGNLQGARALEEKVLEVRTRILGEEHPDTLTSMNNLAESLRSQGHLQDARALQEKALEVCARVRGEEHPDTTISAWNLLHTLFQQGEHQAAQLLLRPHLLWLFGRAPATLSADQQRIRKQLAQILQPPDDAQKDD